MKSRHARRTPEYLQHILDAIDRATTYVAGMDLEAFERDTRTQDAVIRSIEIVGEAANKTRSGDPEFAARFPDVPWDVIYGMRNRIVQKNERTANLSSGFAHFHCRRRCCG